MNRAATNKPSMVQIKEADLNDAGDQEAVVSMVDAYARDVMGNGQPLSGEVRSALIAGLREHPTTHILLAHDEGKPVGIAVCFRGFSTFAARPLLNIHDLAVIAEYRARGIGRHLAAHEVFGAVASGFEVVGEIEHGADGRRFFAPVATSEVGRSVPAEPYFSGRLRAAGW